MMFLETITAFGNDALIPINRIKYVNNTVSDRGGYMIRIKTDDGDYEEHFEKDGDKCLFRYNMIKKILRAK